MNCSVHMATRHLVAQLLLTNQAAVRESCPIGLHLSQPRQVKVTKLFRGASFCGDLRHRPFGHGGDRQRWINAGVRRHHRTVANQQILVTE